MRKRNHAITIRMEQKEVKKLSELCANNNRQLRGIGTNINQMAKIAHQTGTLPSITELESICNEVKILRGGRNLAINKVVNL